MDKDVQRRLNALFEELVPMNGKADSVAGEIVRAINRIGYRWYNDGDQLGIGYGKETCNPAGRYLAKVCNDEIADQVEKLIYDPIYNDSYDGPYDKAFNELAAAVLAYLDENPGLKDVKNEQNMWDCADKEEDVDDEEDEDDYYEEDDYYVRR